MWLQLVLVYTCLYLYRLSSQWVCLILISLLVFHHVQILDVKGKVTAERPDFSVERQKLIHSGKVLKDTATVAESGFKENDFLVCMVTKEVAKPPARAAPAPVAAATATATATTSATDSSAATSAAAAPNPPTAQVTSAATPAAPPAAPPAPPVVEISEDSIAMLTAMGFPDAEARYALTAARGDGNLAVEFLMNGVPDQLANAPTPAAQVATGSAAAAIPAGGNPNEPLAQLRLHPQFTQLQRLVQTNPASLAQVLEAIGQQDANLLAAIHANHDAFVAMMNEPIVEQPAAGAAPGAAAAAAAAAAATAGGMPGAGAGGMPDINPAQLVQMLMGLP